MSARRTSTAVGLGSALVGFGLALVGSALALVGSAASAAVYRCGNAYADVPCAPSAAVVHVDDSRSGAERDAAQAVARREAALASRMEADRERAEAALRPPVRATRARQPVIGAAPAPARLHQRAVRLKLREDADGNFIALVPGSGKRAAKP